MADMEVDPPAAAPAGKKAKAGKDDDKKRFEVKKVRSPRMPVGHSWTCDPQW